MVLKSDRTFVKSNPVYSFKMTFTLKNMIGVLAPHCIARTDIISSPLLYQAHLMPLHLAIDNDVMPYIGVSF